MGGLALVGAVVAGMVDELVDVLAPLMVARCSVEVGCTQARHQVCALLIRAPEGRLAARDGCDIAGAASIAKRPE